MLRSIKQFYGNKLEASDGDIGRVEDFYFDDQNWAVRYLIADTGSWLPGRKVLVTPHSFGSLRSVGSILRVKLTRKQIENSPSIEVHKPVSRQYEEEYFRYYGWPYYWQGNGLWGMSEVPLLEPPAEFSSNGLAKVSGSPTDQADAHLRSTRAVNGYHIQANDGTVGHVCDFVVDDVSWAIRQLVIKTGHRLSGREVQMSVNAVNRISYEESTVFVTMDRDSVERCATHLLQSEDVAT